MIELRDISMSDDTAARSINEASKRQGTPYSWLSAKTGRERGYRTGTWGEDDLRLSWLIALGIIGAGLLFVALIIRVLYD